MNLADVTVQPGRYILAVSGGVDSMVLLNLLHEQPGVQLTIAHFDHGIRQDSSDDRRFVASAAQFYGLPFVYHRAELGPEASEDQARRARYQFLHKVRQAASADAIITAHHQDDVLETAILNMLRGTGRRGLSSLLNTSSIIRPMLAVPKIDIVRHANNHDLLWHEDSTNQDVRYARNHVRHNVVPRLSSLERARFIDIVNNNQRINFQLDQELIHHLHYQDQAHTINRRWFSSLPHNVAREVLAMWLREHGIRDFDSRTLERLTVHAKTQAAGKRANIRGQYWLKVHGDHLALLTA
ncbi:MAG: tRNA lysidine(34) synthetase TilS [Candidatus Saccharimonadales bacterium]